MDKLIYEASDCSLMTRDDLICWLLMFKVFNPQYQKWSFDNITGGISYFFEEKDYIELKLFYEKNIQP